MRHRGFTFTQLVIVVALLGMVTAVLAPVFLRAKDCCNVRTSCQSNLKQIGLAFKQYTQDYDERFPRVSGGTQWGWADVLHPYIKSTWAFQCPTAAKVVPGAQLSSDYFYNQRLATLPEARVNSVALTVLNGDGQNNRSPDVSLWSLPPAWIKDANSPAYRHLKGLNIAFADGHVKWYKPAKITTSSARVGKPTFSIG